MNPDKDGPFCSKRDCEHLAQVKVVLNDPDGSDYWWSCWQHANEFAEWVFAHDRHHTIAEYVENDEMLFRLEVSD